MYLIDTDVISELRKAERGNAGVRGFVRRATQQETPLFVSAITIGELRQGVEKVRYRGDVHQAATLERWLTRLVRDFSEQIIGFDAVMAQVWGRLRVPHADNPLDKQIAATAIVCDLTVVTRNTGHFAPTGVRCLNPFD